MRVAVGLSGGVDSSVAAALLKEKGYEVLGICMKIWDGAPGTGGGPHACYGPDEVTDIEDAAEVAHILEIPFHVVDLTREYDNIVLKYFREEYLSGRTPNPCIRCNQRVKFEVLIEKARAEGIAFDYFATGHYARVEYDDRRKRYLLKKAHDREKDQSYWLAFLSQKQLSGLTFPLGDYTKKEVRKIAKDYRLPTSEKSDSQDFFSGDHTELFNMPAQPGPILDAKGNLLGTHQGIWCYTIGQRKGLGISRGKPLYVVALDEKRNAVIVGAKEELAREELVASNVNFISIDTITEPMKVSLKMRYAQKEFEGVLTPVASGSVHVKFKEPQLSVTPGQAAVFYENDIVVGGGIIEKGEDMRFTSFQIRNPNIEIRNKSQ
jgi:tRNA-specific 2-thiouridylase